MRKKYFGIKKLSKKSIPFVICVILVLTSLSATIGVSYRSTIDRNPQISNLEKNIENIEISQENQNNIQYSFHFNQPSLKQLDVLMNQFTTIDMPGIMNVGMDIGRPFLPSSFVKILLPPMKNVVSVDVSGSSLEVDTEYVDLVKRPILPYQSSMPIGMGRPSEIVIDNSVYDSSKVYPNKRFEEYHISYCRGYTILDITLNPVDYIPGEGKLYYYPELTVTLELVDTSTQNPFYRNTINDRNWVENLVCNPTVVDSYNDPRLGISEYTGGLCNPTDDFDYVIITRASLLDFTGTTYTWDDFINRKEAEGLSTTKVAVEAIISCSDYFNSTSLFNDTAAKIREFCKDAYQDWGTEYILVAGDQDGVASIPRRLLHYGLGSEQENVESDLYWSNLDKNFNADSDSQWGESGDTGFDLYSELFIGSLPCDTGQDLSNWMKKSFYYADAYDPEYLNNAGFYGGDTTWSTQGDDFIDYSAIKGLANYLGPYPGDSGPYPTWLGFQYGFETWNANNPAMPYDLSVKWTAEPPNPGWSGGSESAAINGLKNAINNDQVTLISAIAHANEDMSMDVYDYQWEANYHNTKPFFIHDYGCHCGDMNAADDGVLHSMLFHSDTELAFACVYNTGYGWGNLYSTNSSSSVQQKSFWDYLFDVVNNSGGTFNWQMGRAQAWSKDLMAPTILWDPGYETWRGIIECCLLFGDPGQQLKPPIQPDHNIGIQNLDVSSHEPADTDIEVGATLYNNGKYDETTVDVHFLVNGIEQDSTIISLFEKNTVQDIGWTYHTPPSGWETLTVNVTMVPGENISLDNEKSKDVIYGPDIAVTAIEAPSLVGQGFAKEVKGYIENLGPTDEVITVELFANDIFETNTDIYLTSGDGTWVTFLWDGTNSGLGTYDVVIHAVPVANEYYLANQQLSHMVTVFSAIGSILLVDDDAGNAYESWYESALMGANYVYELWNRDSQGSPSPTVMAGYTAVVWFTGDDYSGTLDSTDRSNLGTYLNNGGRLFVTGQDIGYEIHSDSFYSNYLHATYQTDDTNVYTIVGTTGDAIGDGLTIGISSSDGANNQDYPDGIQPVSPATTCFGYSGSSYKAGIKVETANYRLVYFGFGFEAINNIGDRTTVMSRVLAWLGLEHDIEVQSLNVPDYLPESELAVVQATIRNKGINDETDINVRFTLDDDDYDATVISSLGAGQSTQVSFDWMPSIGDYLVGVETDPVPDEDVLDNNALYQTVHVIAVPDIWIDPLDFDLNMNEGVTEQYTLTIGNEPTAAALLDYSVDNAALWLTLAPQQGTVPVGDADDVILTVDTTGLSEGVYTDQITITTNDLDEPTLTVPVTLSVVFEDDVGAIDLAYPVGSIPMGLHTIGATIENFGGMDQTNVIVNCTITEGIFGTFLHEDFSGGYPPAGWVEQEPNDPEWEWRQTNLAGGTSPEIRLRWSLIDDDYSYLDTPPVDTNGAANLKLKFNSYIDDHTTPNPYYCRVLIRADAADSWTDVTPWSNPIVTDIGPQYESIYIGDDVGSGTQVRFEFEGYYYDLNYWYLDNVEIVSEETRGPGDIAYTCETMVDIPAYSIRTVEFPEQWDAITGSYGVTLTTQLPGDQDTSNDMTTTTIVVTDTVPPEITNVGAAPPFQIQGLPVMISCDVTDYSGVNMVTLDITGPTGYPRQNTTMTKGAGDTYYCEQTYSIRGEYSYYIWAEDTNGFSIQSDLYQFIIGQCGDANGDGMINVSDAVYIINYVFVPGAPTPDPLCSADVNGDGLVNISDAVYIINYIFSGSEPPIEDCCI
jgi:hypothetical protein